MTLSTRSTIQTTSVLSTSVAFSPVAYEFPPNAKNIIPKTITRERNFLVNMYVFKKRINIVLGRNKGVASGQSLRGV